LRAARVGYPFYPRIVATPPAESDKGNRSGMSALLEVRSLRKYFPVRGGLLGAGSARVHAVDGVSLSIAKGETLALVGKSGCGKSTVGKAILRLFCHQRRRGAARRPAHRHAVLAGIAAAAPRGPGRVPGSILEPQSAHARRAILAEPIGNFGLAKGAREMDRRIAAVLDMVRLPRDAADPWPHEFSGGQRQRIGIVRALAAAPELIICGRAVSALDVSVKAQIINLLQDLQRQLELALLFISHDLAAVEHISHRVASRTSGRSSSSPTSARCLPAPSIPTRRRCCRPCRCPIRRRSRGALSSRATSRARSSRPRGAASISAAATPRRALPRREGAGHVVACHLREACRSRTPDGGDTAMARQREVSRRAASRCGYR
jgi:peptide/nickel transport system ATP-binding protein